MSRVSAALERTGISNLFGNGQHRPPPPEMASPDDVAKFNLEWARKNPKHLVDHGTPGSQDYMLPNPFQVAEKQDDIEARHRSKFPWLFSPKRGVRWDFDPILLRNLAQPNTWVGMLVQTITKELAQTPWTIQEAEAAPETAKRLSTNPFERQPLEKQPADQDAAEEIARLIRSPNPEHNFQDLVEIWMGDLLEVGSLTGVKALPEEAFDGDEFTGDPRLHRPVHIQPSPPEIWTKDYDQKTGLLDGFWQFDNEKNPGGGGNQTGSSFQEPIQFSTDEVIWNDLTPRSNRRYGMPPTLLVSDFLQLTDLTLEQEKQYFSKGSIPSGMIVFEEWDREELKEWKSENEENIKGKPHKMLMMAGQSGKVDFVPFSFNFQELQFLERTKWYARVISSVFQVPTAVVGIEPERINYHTFQGERENFESNTLGPYMQQMERVINDQIVHPHWGDGFRFEFVPGMSESTRSLISERVRSEFSSDLLKRNEARRQLGYEEVDEDGFKSDVAPDVPEEPAPGETVEVEDAQGERHEVATADALKGREAGNGRTRTAKDEPLRETEDWQQFEVQPSDIEAIQSELEEDVGELWREILSDEEVQAMIERLADDPDEEEVTEKSLTGLTDRIQELFQDSDIVNRIQDTVRDLTAERTEEFVDEMVSQADEPVDAEQIKARVLGRDIPFADGYAQRMEEEIRETVADGWEEGKGSFEIGQMLEEKEERFSGWEAERIARQELQVATGEARNAFAAQVGKVEVWNTAGDNRVRDAHSDMDGKWKRPQEEWQVDYGDRGVMTEKVPGDSEAGIGCRCVALLVDPDDVDPDDHGGVA